MDPTPKRKRRLFAAAASNEDPPKAADQESDGSDEISSSDEIGKNGVVIKRQPPPQAVAAAELPGKSAGFRAMSSLKRKATRSSPRKNKEAAAAASSKPSAGPLAPEVVGSPHNVAPPPAAAAPSGVVKDLSLQPQEGEYDADRRFKEKSQRYPWVWQTIQTLEKEVSLPLKEAFLKMDDADAEALSNEFEEITRQAMKDLLWEKDNEKMVTDVLTNLIRFIFYPSFLLNLIVIALFLYGIVWN